MRLRAIIVAAFLKRIRHRLSWRRYHRALTSLTVDNVVTAATWRGLSAQDGVQEWLVAKCAHDARRPRRPELLQYGDSSSDSDDW